MKQNGAAVTELKTINPATEEVINRYEIIKDQINDKVKKARNAFDEWKKDSNKRTDLLHDFAQQLRKDKEELAKTATKEMGKAIKEARSEVEKCAWAMEYFADNGIFAKALNGGFSQQMKSLMRMLGKLS
ncbi:MAG: aldehyde dehydrogenase family protein [Candidatus Nitrosopolaris sp.]